MVPDGCSMMDDMVSHHGLEPAPLPSGVVLTAYCQNPAAGETVRSWRIETATTPGWQEHNVRLRETGTGVFTERCGDTAVSSIQSVAN